MLARGTTMPLTLATLELGGGRTFRVEVGDLLRQPVDAIVNAANGHLAHGGGVAAVIADAAGGALEAEGDALVAERGPIPTGEAVVTTAGALPFRGVVHAVGPARGEGQEEAKLVAALRAAFRRAEERGWTSLAFPAVSSGIFAVPLDVCARAYVRAAREHAAASPDGSLRDLRLVVLKAGSLTDLVAAAM
jgi:O-acetyl-ADP-ribose deacetylase (regulator of RNase III)